MIRAKLASGGFYHIFNKSIANFGIFKDPLNGERFIRSFTYYNSLQISKSLSEYLKTSSLASMQNPLYLRSSPIKILASCIMPDHYHLLIKIMGEGFVSHYMNNIENSFTRYFNIKFKRKGPLWQSPYKYVLIESNEELLHVSRYIHLNPTTADLVSRPQDWDFSSYRFYIEDKDLLKIHLPEISIKTPKGYKTFTENQIDYQRNLKHIKKTSLE